jgi:hypothetical protein
MKLRLVDNWRNLWKAASVQVLALGAVLPELLQLLADNSDLMVWFDDGYKSGIRLTCMVAALLLRPVKQTAVSGDGK